ncbi:TPA: hypothetical protein DCZ32_00765 [Candidatus Uhrbacteria bacterium]|nr:hypothetical protein [Candidatus Uhrbacteria bacterium]
MKLLFPKSESGRSQIIDEMNDYHIVPTDQYKRKIRKEMILLEEKPLAESIRNKRVIKLKGTGKVDIYELRIKASTNMAYRLFFAIRSAGYIALHFFLKKSNNYKTSILIATQRIQKYDQNQHDNK